MFRAAGFIGETARLVKDVMRLYKTTNYIIYMLTHRLIALTGILFQL